MWVIFIFIVYKSETRRCTLYNHSVTSTWIWRSGRKLCRILGKSQDTCGQREVTSWIPDTTKHNLPTCILYTGSIQEIWKFTLLYCCWGENKLVDSLSGQSSCNTKGAQVIYVWIKVSGSLNWFGLIKNIWLNFRKPEKGKIAQNIYRL